MLAGLHVVDVDRACVVHGLEVQQVAIVAWDVVAVEDAAVPQQLRGLQRISDTGERRFGRERDHDGAIELFWSFGNRPNGRGIGRVDDGIVPLAVHDPKRIARALWVGLFLQDVMTIEVLTPDRCERVHFPLQRRRLDRSQSTSEIKPHLVLASTSMLCF